MSKAASTDRGEHPGETQGLGFAPLSLQTVPEPSAHRADCLPTATCVVTAAAAAYISVNTHVCSYVCTHMKPPILTERGKQATNHLNISRKANRVHYFQSLI